MISGVEDMDISMFRASHPCIIVQLGLMHKLAARHIPLQSPAMCKSMHLEQTCSSKLYSKTLLRPKTSSEL